MSREESNKDLQRLDNEVISANPSLKNIKPKQRQEILQTIMQVVSVRSHSGPLPDVETLQGYNQIIPNGAERLMQQVEKQSEHRREMERKVISSNNLQSFIGQFFGLLIAGGVLYASYELTMSGHDTVGGILGGTTLVSLVGIFVYGKKKQSQDF